MHDKEEILFTGTKLACTSYINTMEREDYRSVRKVQLDKNVDIWQIIGTLMWAPTPEEIEAECAKIRERLKLQPRYNDGYTANRVRQTDTAEARYVRQTERMSPLEENQFKLPQGWRP